MCMIIDHRRLNSYVTHPFPAAAAASQTQHTNSDTEPSRVNIVDMACLSSLYMYLYLQPAEIYVNMSVGLSVCLSVFYTDYLQVSDLAFYLQHFRW